MKTRALFRANHLQSEVRLHRTQQKPFWEGNGRLPACCKAPDAPANPPCDRAQSTARIPPGQEDDPLPGTQGTLCSPTATDPASSSEQALPQARLNRAPSVFHAHTCSLLQAAPQTPHKYIHNTDTRTYTYLSIHTRIENACHMLAHSWPQAAPRHHCNTKTTMRSFGDFKTTERHLVTGPKQPFLHGGEDEGLPLPLKSMVGHGVHTKPVQKEELHG